MRSTLPVKVAGALLAIAVCTFVAWASVYSDRGDARGPRYVLWKIGVFPFDPTVVYPAMVGDREREGLALGLTVPELERRFGKLRTRETATTEYQRHYSDRFLTEKKIYWLGDSPWLVVIENDRAVELHLMKG